MAGRRSVRLAGWDYRTAGAYFVTICTHGRAMLFDDRRFLLVAETIWRNTPTRVAPLHVSLDAWVVMPNHLHGIIVLHGNPGLIGHDRQSPVGAGPPGGDHWSPPRSQVPVGSPSAVRRPSSRPPRNAAVGSLGAIIGAYKSHSARHINHLRHTPGAPVWQRGYYERVVRNDHEIDQIRDYIHDNPARWAAGRDALDTLLAHMIHQA